jgi:hypothetical protein
MIDNDLQPATRGHVERKLKAIGACSLRSFLPPLLFTRKQSNGVATVARRCRASHTRLRSLCCALAEEAVNYQHSTHDVKKMVEMKQKAGASVGNSSELQLCACLPFARVLHAPCTRRAACNAVFLIQLFPLYCSLFLSISFSLLPRNPHQVARGHNSAEERAALLHGAERGRGGDLTAVPRGQGFRGRTCERQAEGRGVAPGTSSLADLDRCIAQQHFVSLPALCFVACTLSHRPHFVLSRALVCGCGCVCVLSHWVHVCLPCTSPSPSPAPSRSCVSIVFSMLNAISMKSRLFIFLFFNTRALTCPHPLAGSPSISV